MNVRKDQFCSIKTFAQALIEFQNNKFDGLAAVGGDRGVGKSVFTRILLREYCNLSNLPFDLSKFTYYSKKLFDKEIETNEERQIFFLDEAISILFNRERLEDMQVDLIKKLNICRYKKHLIICLAPNFFNLDKGVRDLVRVYIYIDKRPINGQPGYAQIFMKANRPFVQDPWFMKKNEKLGRNYNKSPNYWGTIVIPDCSAESWFVKMEEDAEKIKDEKKAIALDESADTIKADKKLLYPIINHLYINGWLKKGWLNDLSAYFHVDAKRLGNELGLLRLADGIRLRNITHSVELDTNNTTSGGKDDTDRLVLAEEQKILCD